MTEPIRYEPWLLNRWWTVPRDYGHLSGSWLRRLYIETIWRLRGRQGLDEYLQRRVDRLRRRAIEAADKLAVGFAEGLRDASASAEKLRDGLRLIAAAELARRQES